MAKEKADDGDLGEFAADIDQNAGIDQAVGELRGVLKKDAGEIPVVENESDDMMGGAAAFGSDFGADFADEAADGGPVDPFGIGDDGELMADHAAGAFGTADFTTTQNDDFGLDAGARPDEQSGPDLGPSGAFSRLDVVLDIPIDVQIILGTSRMAVSDLMDLSKGATIALDRRIGEPVEITANGRIIGRGEVTVLDADETRFGVRMIEVYGAAEKKG